MNTKTNFKIAPVVGDWVNLEGNPRKIETQAQINTIGDLFQPVSLTPAVMGWIGEALPGEDNKFEIFHDAITIHYMQGSIHIDRLNEWVELHNITHLHHLQQLYRLLSGGQELTIEPK